MSDQQAKIINNPARAKFTVLLAEDDFAIANMLSISLNMAGYKTVVAENGKLAVERILNYKPQLILMDINMPEMQGFEALDELKKQGYTLGSAKVIFLTNSSSPGDMTKAKSYNAGYKVKADLTPRELVDLADKTLNIN
jgi:CheY-like chemotaxis protein